jgi:hypothetical protein
MKSAVFVLGGGLRGTVADGLPSANAAARHAVGTGTGSAADAGLWRGAVLGAGAVVGGSRSRH